MATASGRGFTLIELVVVLVIVGAVAGAMASWALRPSEGARVRRAALGVMTGLVGARLEAMKSGRAVPWRVQAEKDEVVLMVSEELRASFPLDGAAVWRPPSGPGLSAEPLASSSWFDASGRTPARLVGISGEGRGGSAGGAGARTIVWIELDPVSGSVSIRNEQEARR
ncbi:MAG: prepilin-type N-terminal cleavage/methylation domain-containing protein [Planctomycetota bacterium]|nr:prepilin-type N-terminal cleavage/methylation domain-containing protein [Planctomycetota bacterium]